MFVAGLVVLIEDMQPPYIMHKYICDTTFTVKVQKGSSDSMQTHVNQDVLWSPISKMIPNVDKTKDIVNSFHKQSIDIAHYIEGLKLSW